MLLGLKCGKWKGSQKSQISVSCAIICLSNLRRRMNTYLVANNTIPSLNGIPLFNTVI